MTKRPRISESATVLARQARKRAEIALLIPALGCVIFMSPLLDAFGLGAATLQRQFVGIFGIWSVLILFSFAVRRLLRPDIEGD